MSLAHSLAKEGFGNKGGKQVKRQRHAYKQARGHGHRERPKTKGLKSTGGGMTVHPIESVAICIILIEIVTVCIILINL